MTRARLRLAACAAAVLVIVAAPPQGTLDQTTRAAAGHAPRAAFHLEAPPPGYTGGFGEPTCLECHFDGPLNDPGGSLTLVDLPATYAPGRSYAIVVALEHPDLAVAGFELTARFADGGRAGQQAGRLAALPGSGLAVTDSAGVSYLHHTAPGTTPDAPGAARWVIEWTAPLGGEAVLFHAAANAANDDNSPFGDWIFATEGRVEGAEK